MPSPQKNTLLWSVIVVILLVSPTLVSGQIGATNEECNRRYGAPFVSESQTNCRVCEYVTFGYFILCEFRDNKCCGVMLRRRSPGVFDPDKPLAVDDQRAKDMLRVNGKGWTRDSEESWVSEDGLVAKRAENYFILRRPECSEFIVLKRPIRLTDKNIGDFLDQPNKYQQHRLKVRVRIDDDALAYGTLRDQLGETIVFTGMRDAKTRFGMNVRMPEDPSQVVAARHGRLVILVFRCNGSLTEGNQAVRVMF